MDWCKFYAEWGTDPKVQSMSEPMRCRHAMLLSLRCAQDVSLLAEDELLYYFRLTPEELAETKALFVKKGFIDKHWNVLKWDKRQNYVSPSAQRMRSLRERVRDSFELPADIDLQASYEQEAQRDAQLAHAEEDKTREEQKRKTPRAPRRGGTLIDFVLPDWIPENDWNDWLAMRKAKRAPTTVGAMVKAVKDLDKLRAEGHQPADVLQQSVLRCWTGLFPIAQPYTNGTPIAPSAKPTPVITPEQQERISARLAKSLDY